MSDAIDVHNHVVPEQFPKYAGKGTNVPWPSMADAHACHKHVMISGKVYRTVSDGCWSVPRRIEDMGKQGVARQAISPMPELLSYWLPLDDAKVMVRYLNEQIAAMIGEAPGRFIGLGCVPLQDTDSAIRELQHVIKDLKFSGVEIASHVNDTSIGDARFEPFFTACEKLGAAVFVHALRPAGMERIVGAFSEQAVLFPNEIAIACASMITGGVAARHPKLRIAFSHGGGTMSILLPRLVHAWNMVQKTKESLTESPAVTAKRFYYDNVLFDSDSVKFLVNRFGAGQVLVGSDYPFALGEQDPLGRLDKAGFDSQTKNLITSANAKRFLGLPEAPR
ncbi:MAG TPA: amidohydrolase family protein [Burkholderiales bacterium]